MLNHMERSTFRGWNTSHATLAPPPLTRNHKSLPNNMHILPAGVFDQSECVLCIKYIHFFFSSHIFPWVLSTGVDVISKKSFWLFTDAQTLVRDLWLFPPLSNYLMLISCLCLVRLSALKFSKPLCVSPATVCLNSILTLLNHAAKMHKQYEQTMNSFHYEVKLLKLNQNSLESQTWWQNNCFCIHLSSSETNETHGWCLP